MTTFLGMQNQLHRPPKKKEQVIARYKDLHIVVVQIQAVEDSQCLHHQLRWRAKGEVVDSRL
jgi:hypothetical protein